jgi:hypothetical protein
MARPLGGQQPHRRDWKYVRGSRQHRERDWRERLCVDEDARRLDIALLVAHKLKYPYKKTPPPDGKFDWLPILSVQIGRSSNLTTLFEAIVDSGAFDCLFHADLQEPLE